MQPLQPAYSQQGSRASAVATAIGVCAEEGRSSSPADLQECCKHNVASCCPREGWACPVCWVLPGVHLLDCCWAWLLPVHTVPCPPQDHPDFRQAASLLEEVDDRVVKQGLVGLGVGAGLAAVVGLGLGLLLGGGRRH